MGLGAAFTGLRAMMSLLCGLLEQEAHRAMAAHIAEAANVRVIILRVFIGTKVVQIEHNTKQTCLFLLSR